MATHLKRLKLDRIDLVDRGANPGAHIALFKRHTTNGVPLMPETPPMTEAEQIADLTAKLAKANADLEEATKPPVKPDDIEKNLSPEVKALLAKARADKDAADAVNKANDERIAKLEAERDRNQMIAKASEFKALGAVEDLTAILLPIKKAAPKETYDALLAKMKGWDEVARTSALFKEVGGSGESDNDPDAKLNLLAKQYHEKHPDLTEQQAYAKTLESPEGKALFKASQLAKRGGK